ncbi:SET domain-containing protein [Spirosoma pollinicola]|uniref:SET domain-containing protein-lysine N-methyltransferase n=1 Tax=Spirosoma pollinicola TaxID=2057025 RepID=A0A2K8Z0C9_9BACT|nr:SET domain-containing protein-lysine N-methyltransferase [Spirosoma pollinicola]AUD03346.1 hypothetical protein CWM47_16800 [Spirosoma pollinicola]
MIHPDTYVHNTTKGLGLFAKRRFERGEIIWIIDDIDAKLALPHYFALDALQQKKLNIYSYLDNQNRVIIPWDEGKYVNHSCAPNSTGLLEFDNISVALRTIEPDEEIVEDYSSYYGHFESFICYCGASSCRGFVTQNRPFQAELRLTLAEIAPALLSMPQTLLTIQSSENDLFLSTLQNVTFLAKS